MATLLTFVVSAVVIGVCVWWGLPPDDRGDRRPPVRRHRWLLHRRYRAEVALTRRLVDGDVRGVVYRERLAAIAAHDTVAPVTVEDVHGPAA